MLTLKAHLIGIYQSSDYKKEDGEVVKGKTKLQLLSKIPLKNGTTKNQLIDLSIPVDKVHKYKGKENTEIEVEVALIGQYSFYGV